MTRKRARRPNGRHIVRAVSVGAVATTLTLGLAPASQAASWDELVESYRDPAPDDSGGYDASASLVKTADVGKYRSWFHAKGEVLVLADQTADGRRAQAEVRVYRHADADGIPYDLVDTDRFSTGSSRNYNLGTPDGSGNIPEGYWIALRVSFEGHSWSSWAYGRA